MKYQYINGKRIPTEEARIPLNDLGLLRSYSVFDFLRILDGTPVFLEDHLDRLFNSARLMSMELGWSRAEIAEMCRDLVSSNSITNAGLKLIATGGFSVDGYTPSTPNLFITAGPLSTVASDDFTNGRGLITSEYQRDMPEVKTTIYVHSIQLADKMKAQHAVEVMYHSHGIFTECSRSNIFFVTSSGGILTPKSNILKGITRKQVLEICANDYNISQEDIRTSDLNNFSECFITSSTKTILPIVKIDDTAIGDGSVGPVTRDIMNRFDQHVNDYLNRASN